MLEKVFAGIDKVKKLSYKPVLVVGAFAVFGFVGKSSFNQYKQLKSIENAMNAGTPEGNELVDVMTKNGLADEVYTILDEKCYILLDKEVGKYSASKTPPEELDNKINAAKEFDFKVSSKYVIVNEQPVKK